MVRTQIYLTEEEERALTKLARELGTTKAQLIRDALKVKHFPMIPGLVAAYA